MSIEPIGVSTSAPAKRPTSFQVFGERRSGTNFAAALLHANTELEPKFSFGWKHGFPLVPVLPPETLFVTVVRDPLDWVQAFYRSPYEAHAELLDLSFADFIRTEWHSVYRPYAQQWAKWGFGNRPEGARRGQELQLDRHPVEGRRFANIMEMRKLKLQGHLSLLQRGLNAIVLRYEDLKAHPAACLQAISRQFDVPLGDDIQTIEQTVSPNTYPADRKEGLEISREDRAFILSQLDMRQERACGYFQPGGRRAAHAPKRRPLVQAVAQAQRPTPRPTLAKAVVEAEAQPIMFTTRRRQLAASA